MGSNIPLGLTGLEDLGQMLQFVLQIDWHRRIFAAVDWEVHFGAADASSYLGKYMWPDKSRTLHR